MYGCEVVGVKYTDYNQTAQVNSWHSDFFLNMQINPSSLDTSQMMLIIWLSQVKKVSLSIYKSDQ